MGDDNGPINSISRGSTKGLKKAFNGGDKGPTKKCLIGRRQRADKNNLMGAHNGPKKRI